MKVCGLEVRSEESAVMAETLPLPLKDRFGASEYLLGWPFERVMELPPWQGPDRGLMVTLAAQLDQVEVSEVVRPVSLFLNRLMIWRANKLQV